MIIDKQNNLNIYKEDTRKVGKDKETSKSSCCSSDDSKAAEAAEVTQSACCSSTQNYGEATLPKISTGNCCGTNSQTNNEEARNVIDIDFNEWVGEFMTFSC
jgi:hypothetical protein